MTYVYQLEFQGEIELDDDERPVAGVPASTSHSVNRLLVESGTPEEPDEYICEAQTDGGGVCQREVDSPDETCWDH